MDTSVSTLQKDRASSAKVVTDFLSWLSSHGVDLSKVELRRSQGKRLGRVIGGGGGRRRRRRSGSPIVVSILVSGGTRRMRIRSK